MGMAGGGGGATVQRGGGRKRRRRRMVADINITPLVDVMLVLLVIFIVTAPSMTKDGVDVDLPHAKGTAGGGTNAAAIVVSVDPTGRVYVGDKSVEAANIDTEIPKLLKGHESETVTVRGDTNARHGSVIKVLSALRAAGITKVSFAVSGEGGK